MANSKRLSATITIGGAVLGSLRSALGDTKNRIGQVGDAVRQLERNQRNLQKSIRTFGEMGKNVDGLRARYATVTAEIDRQRRALERLKRVEAVDAARKSNQERRKDLGGKIVGTAATGAAVFAPLGAAIAKTTEFNYQLQLIGNTANMSRAEIAQLGAVITTEAKNTNNSAEDMQKALGFLIAAGMDVKTAQQTISQVGRAATASGGEIEDMARAAFTLNDSLGIAPGAAMLAALDTLAQAGKDGNVELKDMAKQLPVLGSGFQALKMQGRDAAATMGAALEIARKGAADADEAANNMKNYIAKIMSPETLKKAKKNFHIDLYKIIQDAQKSGGNPFEASMQAIIKATKGDQKAIGDLFQDMQVQNFVRPMIQNWDKYKEIKDRALKADGTTDQDFEKIMATSKMKIKELTTAFGRLALSVGDAFDKMNGGGKGGGLAAKVDAVTEFVKANEGLVVTTAKVAGGIIGLRLATLGLGYAYTFLKGGALSVIGLFYRFGAAGAAAGAGGAAAGTGAAAASGGITLLGRAVLFAGRGLLWLGRSLLLNPIGLAITAVAAGAYLIYKNWEPIKGFFARLWDDVSATFQKAIGWIDGKLGKIGEAWAKAKSLVGLGDSTVTAAATVNQVAQAAPAAARTSPAARAALAPGLPAVTVAPVLQAPASAPAAQAPVARVMLAAAQPAAAPGERAPQPPVPPRLPQVGARNTSSVVDNRQYHFKIQQQPGQDARQLAEQIKREMDSMGGIQRRGMMIDSMGAQ